jgi:hypothetical protein
MTQIDTLFDRMDVWRHFPNYQLERRADLFFAPYLVEVLEARLGFPLCPDLIPEFPVRIGTIYPDDPTNNQSCKIDYVALSAARDKVVFVELKTEARSRRDKQDEYLLAAQKAGLRALLQGLLHIFRVTKSKRKYFCLLAYLERMGLLRLPEGMKEIMAQPTLRGVTKASRQVEININPAESFIRYVQPNGTARNVIPFRDFAEVVRKHDDPMSQRFARSLLEWADVQAGEKPVGYGA